MNNHIALKPFKWYYVLIIISSSSSNRILALKSFINKCKYVFSFETIKWMKEEEYKNKRREFTSKSTSKNKENKSISGNSLTTSITKPNF